MFMCVRVWLFECFCISKVAVCKWRVGERAVCWCEQTMFVIEKMITQATELNRGALCPAAADAKAFATQLICCQCCQPE
jgi:hypothetical protein